MEVKKRKHQFKLMKRGYGFKIFLLMLTTSYKVPKNNNLMVITKVDSLSFVQND